MNISFSTIVRRKLAWIAATCIIFGFAGCGHSPDLTAADSDGEQAEAHDASEQESSGVKVRVAPVEMRNFVERVSGLGRCEALPEMLASLTPAIEGQVQTLLAKPGDAVHAGHPLVEFNKAVALADYAEKTVARDGLVASLKLLTAPPRPDEERISRLGVEQAKIAVAKAQSVVDRLRPLHQRSEVSDQQFFEAEQNLATAQAQQQTAEAQHKLLMSGPRAEAIAQAQAKIDAADKTAALSKAQLDLLTIRAPIDGVLDSLECHLGQTVAAGTVIGQVVDIHKVFATVWLPTMPAHRVRTGQTGRVYVAAVQSTANHTAVTRHAVASGQVAFVGEVADPQTGNVPIRIEIANAENRLKIGETVEVAIEVGEPDMRLAVPVEAITDTGEGAVLSVVREGKTVVLHPEVGAPVEGWVPVLAKGLQVGETVIVEGAYHLPEGTEVETVSRTDEKPHG